VRFWVSTFVLAVVVSITSFYATLAYIPINEMRKAEKRIATVAGGRNVIRHGTRATSKFRSVVRPSPDQLYSACVYDLSKGPVRFSGSIPDTYWSLSMFSHNSDNFFVVNDSQIEGQTYDYVLVKEGQRAPEGVPTNRVIVSPSKTGIALVRIFIDKDDRLEELDRIRRLGNCSSLANEN